VLAAEAESRAELMELDPARADWGRFSALAEGGNPLATLWRLHHAPSANLSPEDLKTVGLDGFRTLFFEHQDRPDLLDSSAYELGTYVALSGVSPYSEMLYDAFEAAEDHTVKGLIAFHLGNTLGMSEDESQRAEAKDWLMRVADQFKDTSHGLRAADALFILERLCVGAIAPDFGGLSIDEEEIKLSDQRGKIVVVDFFGFW
jgi:hypothetical protein